MSDIVKDITLAFEGQVAATLPTYQELDFKYNLDDNNYFNNLLRFGVIPQSAFSTPTTTKAVTLTQSFSLILTNEYVNQDDTDFRKQEAVFELHDSLNEVYKLVVANKLGIPSQVFDVEIGAIEAPLFNEESKVVILITDFLIQYRTPF